jgi:hypothetical protein
LQKATARFDAAKKEGFIAGNFATVRRGSGVVFVGHCKCFVTAQRGGFNYLARIFATSAHVMGAEAAAPKALRATKEAKCLIRPLCLGHA